MAAKKRRDQSGDGAPLTDNPFGVLGPAGQAPAAPSPNPPGESPPAKDAPAPSWRVQAARKGGWRLSIEKRAGGKTVTVLSSVEGDRDSLLKALRKACGAGGAVSGDDAVELQGDHRQSIAAWLDARGGQG